MDSIDITGILSSRVEHPETGPSIDGQNIAEMIEKTFGDAVSLTVMVGVHAPKLIAEGAVDVYQGDAGWSELTDWILDRMMIGGVDVLEELRSLDGKTVTLRVDNGPLHQDPKTWGHRSTYIGGKVSCNSSGELRVGAHGLVDRVRRVFLPDENGNQADLSIALDTRTPTTDSRVHFKGPVSLAFYPNRDSAAHMPPPDRLEVGGIDVLAEVAKFEGTQVHLSINDSARRDH